ncbi:MAG: hypothetical protein DPW16_12865 [Chloroflexi bacterium]|nr:hypothetical protein [Chloroflexota bacterium]
MEPITERYIKGYALREKLGDGGFGAVYRAYQPTVGREVAIKVILPTVANHPDFIRRFDTEAQVIAQLEHLHIVPLYDYWRDPTGGYLVMRWLKGGSLREALGKEPFSLEAVMLMMNQITSALEAAHRAGIIHRDIKPANILFDEDGNAYLADFGIAKDLTNSRGNNTGEDVIIGTLDYISPEQGRSDPVSPRTDLYSLGVVLYEALTGQHPFPGLTSVERLYKHLNDPLPLINDDGIPPPVNDVIQKATAKNPAHRYRDALEMVAAFREAVSLGNKTSDNPVEYLTLREQEILLLIVKGLSNKEIAQRLTFTVGTVKWYITQIYKKLHVRSRVQAIVRARELDLITTHDFEGQSTIIGAMAIPTSKFQPENPYKGLRAFKATDHDDFFGQEKLIAKLIKRLGESGENNRFLAVVGPSGSGKSSLVKAGLIPALWRGELPNSERWYVVEMLPGRHPLDELEVALTRVAANQASSLHEHLTRDARGLIRAAQIILPDDASDLVVIIDQFEEMFTLVDDETARTDFLNLIHAAVTDDRSRVRVIITLRADFYDRPLQYPQIGELVRSRMETILPLAVEGLERAIVRPAERVGVSFEAGLVASIIQEIHYQPGALPLLQYALTELFEQRQGRILTHEAYQAIGQTTGALAKRAELIHAELSPELQEANRQMFLRLVTLGEGTEDTRRRVTRREILTITDTPDAMDEMIDTFAAYRLLSLDHDPASREPTVEVAHEAILREWERLRAWLNESREEIKLQRRLAEAVEAWVQNQREISYLLQGVRLGRYENWAKETTLALTPLEREFLQASITERERHEAEERERQAYERHLEKRSIRVLRALVGVLLVASFFGIILTSAVFYQSRVASDERDKAERQAQLAFARELAAASVSNLDIDPERSVLLALHSLEQAYTLEGENALHRALPELHIIRTLEECPSLVWGVDYSPDGTRIAAGCWDGNVYIWDAQTGDLLHTLKGHTDKVHSVAYSPDGKYLVSGSFDATAKIWDTETGQVLFTLAGHQPLRQSWVQGILSVAFSPDGKFVATGGSDHTARLWDAATGKELLVLSNHIGVVESVAFSPDSKVLATGDYDQGTVRVWSLVSGELLFEYATALFRGVDIYALSFNMDGTRLVFANGFGQVKALDSATGDEVLDFRNTSGGIWRAKYSPDGQWLATGGFDGRGRIWNASNGYPQFVLSGHRSAILNLDFNPNGNQLVTSSGDHTLKIWDLSAGHEVFTTTGLLGVGVDYHPSAGLFATSEIVLLDGQATAVVLEKNWDDRSYLMGVANIPDPDYVWSLDYNPAGTHIAVGVSNGKVELYGTDGNLLWSQQGHSTWVKDIEFSPDGKHIFSGSVDGTAILWDSANGDQILVLDNHDQIWGVAYSPDGLLLATADYNYGVSLWDAVTGERKMFLESDDLVYDVDFSPNGNWIAASRQGGSIIVWDAHTGEKYRTFCCHTGLVFALEFSPDSVFVGSASYDKTVKIWDMVTGNERLALTGSTNSVFDLSFSPDGKHFVAADYGGAIRGYTLDLNELISIANRRVTRDFTLEECQKFLHLETCP